MMRSEAPCNYCGLNTQAISGVCRRCRIEEKLGKPPKLDTTPRPTRIITINGQDYEITFDGT